MAAPELDDLLRLAAALADESGAIIQRYFRTGIAVDDKADLSPVTVADREAEAAMRRLIEQHVPAHGIVGEEYGRKRPEADYVWVLDPIDGTKSFITGKPLFGTLIGLMHEGRALLGVINHPALGERWVGARGRPTLFNGRPVGARPCEALAQAALYATSPYMFKRKADAAAFERVRKAVKLAGFGCDCYHYGLLASGTVDLVIEAGLAVYDYAGAIAVIEGAGGVFTDWRGRPLDLESDGRVAAAGDPRAHAQLLALLAGKGG